MRGIVNGFKVIAKRNGEKWFIQIKYLEDEMIIETSQKYSNLDEQQVVRIEKILKDHTYYNLKKAFKLCEAIPLETIRHEVESIVYE